MHSAERIIILYLVGSDYLLTNGDGKLDSDTRSICTMVHVPDNNLVEETKLVELIYTVDPVTPHIIIDQYSTEIQVLDNDGNI